jgi:lantibiotic modifying enzyme
MRVHDAFRQFLQTLRELGFNHDTVVPPVHLGDSSGWSKWFDNVACESEAEVVKYYTNLGGLIFLLYVLNGTDVHSENLIACGPAPAIIDLECLFTNIDGGEKFLQSQPGYWRQTGRRSVLETGILPVRSKDFNSVLLSEKSVIDLPREWRPRSNDCMIGSQLAPSARYISEICGGFRYAYRFFQQRRTEIARVILERFSDLPVRVTFRETRTYDQIKRRLLEGRFLSSGIDFSIELDLLFGFRQSALSGGNIEIPDKVILEEIASIKRMDTPIFVCFTTGHDVLSLEGDILAKNHFSRAPMELVIRNVGELADADCSHQVELITMSLCGSV